MKRILFQKLFLKIKKIDFAPYNKGSYNYKKINEKFF